MLPKVFRRGILGNIPFTGAGVLMSHRRDDGSWHVLLFRRAIEPHRGRWSVVGGRQERGESPAQTALREAVEEAFGGHRPEMFGEKLAAYLPERFDIAACRSVRHGFPGVFSYRTYLVEFTGEVPLDVFTPNWESDAWRWFPTDRLPPEAHCTIPGTVRRLGLLADCGTSLPPQDAATTDR